jgi:hypothetical protein
MNPFSLLVDSDDQEDGVELPEVNIDADEAIDAISNERRRWVLQEVAASDSLTELGEIATERARLEVGHEPSTSERKRVYVALYQTHLPKLASIGAVDYNDTHGIVKASDQTDALAELASVIIEACQADHGPDIRADGSGYVCDDCGEGFDTLTELRLHEKDDCRARAVYGQFDPDSPNVEDEIAPALLTCQECGGSNHDIQFEETASFADGDYHLIVEFECQHCAFENENRVVMEGVDRDDLDDLPEHLQPEDPELATDGGTTGAQGAIDHDFGENEKETREILDENLRGIKRAPEPGDVAIDLVTRQIVFVDCVVADTIIEYYDAEEFDLRSYKTHPYLPIRLDDTVYGVVYVERSVEGIHNAGDIYPTPRGRLARVPVEQATPKWGDD